MSFASDYGQTSNSGGFNQAGQTDKDNAANVGDPGGLFHKNSNKQQDQPPQPDYIGAANATSFGSIQAALANNYMSQPNVNTPLGQQTWKQVGSNTVNIPGYGDIAIPKMQQDVTLSPEQQKLYEGQTGLQQNLLDQSTTKLNSPFTMDSANDVADKAYGAVTSRLDPTWARRDMQQETQLKNQGLVPGGEAYDNAMKDFNMAKNDAYQQANLAAIQTMPQTLQMEQTLRDQPLNEMNALKTGSPVNMPQFQPTQYNQSAQGPNALGATAQQGQWQQAMYNSGVQQQNAQKQGMMGLGSAALMAFL